LPDGEVCDTARKLGLRCHQGHGGLYELRQLDRPAVLALHGSSNALSYVLLTRLNDTTATLTAGGKHKDIPVAELAAQFDGGLPTLWKMDPEFREQIGERDHGADVDWLAAHIAQSLGQGAPRPNKPLDQMTLRAFQHAQNMKIDGVAGPRTYMRLNQLD